MSNGYIEMTACPKLDRGVSLQFCKELCHYYMHGLGECGYRLAQQRRSLEES